MCTTAEPCSGERSALDQLLSKTYSDSTPSVNYTYSHGWRTADTSGNTTYASNAFDGLGRVTAATQTTNGPPYTFTVGSIGASGYNLIDEITSMTLPSGTVITSGYDLMGRPSNVSAQAASASSATSYVAAVSRTPGGAVGWASLGNGLTEQNCYNDRQQPTIIRHRRNGTTSCSNTGDSNDVGYLGFTFPAGGNNGNLSSQTVQYAAAPGYQAMSFTQNYAYDQANRIASVSENSSAPWSQYFDYDALGNRWLYSGAQFDPSTPVTGAVDPFDGNNRLSGAGYNDGRGNQTTDGGYAFQYDAENRPTSSSMSGSTLAAYSYDADGHRVTKIAGGETTIYVYNPQGELAAEYTTGATTTPCATTCYLMTDHLGSTRMETDANGNQIQLFDYAPFGEQLGSAGGRDGRWAGYEQSGIHFTGKEQEGYESAYMYYFGARYFSGGLGRFSSPDRPFSDQMEPDPQSWNMYSYVRNNPLRFIDPSGNDCVYAQDNGSGYDVSVARGQCSKGDGGYYVDGTIDVSAGYAYNAVNNSIGLSTESGGTAVVGLRGGSSVTDSDLLGAVADGAMHAQQTVNYAGAATAIALGGIAAGGVMLAGEGVGALGLELLPSQARNFQTIETIIADHVTMTDLAGGAKEAAGFTIRNGEKIYNHQQELRDAATGLARAIKNLQGSLNDPTHGTVTRQIVQQAIQRAQTYIRMINAALGR